MIDLDPESGSVVKPYPATFGFRFKYGVVAIAVLLVVLLWAGRMDEIRVAQPVEEESVPVYTQSPEEEIDYDEFMNRLPLRKPEPKPAMDWLSKGKAKRDVG